MCLVLSFVVLVWVTVGGCYGVFVIWLFWIVYCLVLWGLWLVCFAGLLTAVSSCGIVVWLCVFVFAFGLLLICLFGYALCLVGLPLAGCGFGGLHLAGGWVTVGVWLVFDCCR